MEAAVAESGRLREPLEYCHQFGEIVHSQTALKFAYLKAMSYHFCCMVQVMMWSLKDINGAGLGIPYEKISLQWPDKLCNGILWTVLEEKRGGLVRPCENWRRTVERECKNLNKTWPDLKQLVQSRVLWRVVIVDALCPGWDQGN